MHRVGVRPSVCLSCPSTAGRRRSPAIGRHLPRPTLESISGQRLTLRYEELGSTQTCCNQARSNRNSRKVLLYQYHRDCNKAVTNRRFRPRCCHLGSYFNRPKSSLVRPLACNWYYCAQLTAKLKAACALRFNWAATSSNLGL